MAYCEKCGAYIPIGETACPACGYDPEEEARKAKEAEEEARRKAAEEEARRKAEAAAEAARKKAAAEEEARRKARADSWAEQERKREEARRRAEQQARQSYTSGAAHSQYTSQRTGQSSAYQSQYASQRTGSAQQWAPPWQETRDHGQSQSANQGYTGSQSQQYADMRAKAADSAANQKLSILSYIPWVPTFLIPLFLRKDDDFARYHANQGLSLFLVTAAASALGSVSGLIPAAGGIFALYGMIKGMSNVAKGKKEPLPLIGSWKLIK